MESTGVASEKTDPGSPDPAQADGNPGIGWEWDEQARDAYASVAKWLGGFFLLITLFRLALVPPGPVRVPLILESVAMMAAFGLTGRFILPISRRLGDVENTGLWLMGLAVVNALCLAAALPGPSQSASFLMVQVGAGVAFRSRWRFALVQALALLTWAGAFLRWVGSAALLAEAFTLLSGLLISTAMWLFLNRLLRSLAVLRAKDRILLRQRMRLVSELRVALDNVKTLRGLIPICSYCKRVRDDQGFWNQVEAYIYERSEAKFSHGICPNCTEQVEAELEAMKRSPIVP